MMPNDSHTPAISILTTCYNREKYLGECIQSVLDGHFQDFELIIVDDGSTDRSVEIAKEFAARDPRIRVFQNEKNLGDYPNRNNAASYARGKFIKYLDADDMHGRFMVDIMVDAMETHPEAALGLFDYGKHKPLFPKLLLPHEAFEAHYTKKQEVFARSPLNAIIKREVFNALGGFSGKRMVGDFEMWHNIAAQYPIVVMSAGPGLYREHEEQEMSLHRADPLWALKYINLSLDFLSDDDCPMDDTSRQLVLSDVKRKQARTILYSLKRNGIKDTIRLKKASALTWKIILRNAFLPKYH